MSKYTVAQVGCGSRGEVHLDAWLGSPDCFELVALCEMDAEKMKTVADARGIQPAFYADADKMLAEVQPDIFCFSTQPNVRLPLVELAAKHKVKGLLFEKPMATSLVEARKILEICQTAGIKAVVSHQQKYLNSMQKVKALVDEGAIGEITEVHGSALGNMTGLGTHFMDYIMWANNGHPVRWVVGHAHGRKGLEGGHPSPDFIMARMEFENGVRGLLEFGTIAPSYMHGDDVPNWLDNRLTVYGTHGYAWADTDGCWSAVTKDSGGEVLSGTGPGYDPNKPGAGWMTQQADIIQIPCQRELADWLDDDKKVHSCNVETAFHGFEVLSAACLSALDHTRIDLPLTDRSRGDDIFDRMKNELPDVPKINRA